ncbi:uncharacterized protein LOC106770376 [Vigna radiata var. radiata]|uniref:Uncharacterized protein LOC106770376 n=1 Tax=Vigna radiata var. radiata TaxID=3916 RepID=A0A1S3V0G3_VIGRR|nr:uncharacterized protein LOC106770376 [Vigna radiata var. radiata]
MDKAKVEVIEKLPPPMNVKGIRSFLGHAGFYRRFIKDFSKIVKPLSNLLVKDTSFVMSEECLQAFDVLKKSLISAPVIIAPDWSVMLGQRRDKVFHAIYYASKVLNEAQLNYATTEKEFFAIVYALEKFRSYLIGSKVIIYTDHATIKYLLTKPDSKPRNCDKCQRTRPISRWHEMPLQGILEVEVYDCWGIDFVGPFPPYFNNEYIVVAVDYVSKWVEALASLKNDANVVIKFLKRKNFSRFGTPKVLINDGGSHFCNSQLAKVLKHYGVRDKVVALYHPQTNGQAEVSNWEIKRILEKTVAASRKDWSHKLDDAHWAYGTTMKTSMGLLLGNRKLKSKWSGPFVIKKVHPHGSIDLLDPTNSDPDRSWVVNGQRLKHYLGGEVERLSTVMKLVDL